MSFAIRRACAGDENLLHSLILKLADFENMADQVISTPADLTRDLFQDEPRCFAEIAERSGKACGFALWFYNYSTFHGRHGLYLEDLFVEPEYRGQGIGKALLQHLAGICARENLTRLQWWVLNWNAPAIDFYRAMGAVPQDEWTVYRLTGAALAAQAR